MACQAPDHNPEKQVYLFSPRGRKLRHVKKNSFFQGREDLGGPTAGYELASWPGPPPPPPAPVPDPRHHPVYSGPWPYAEYEQVRLCLNLNLHGAFEHLPPGAFAGRFTPFGVIRAYGLT